MLSLRGSDKSETKILNEIIQGVVEMRCTNYNCPIFVICQKKDVPPARCGSAKNIRKGNGYAAMAFQEQALRASAIEFTGNWEA